MSRQPPTTSEPDPEKSISGVKEAQASELHEAVSDLIQATTSPEISPIGRTQELATGLLSQIRQLRTLSEVTSESIPGDTVQLQGIDPLPQDIGEAIQLISERFNGENDPGKQEEAIAGSINYALKRLEEISADPAGSIEEAIEIIESINRSLQEYRQNCDALNKAEEETERLNGEYRKKKISEAGFSDEEQLEEHLEEVNESIEGVIKAKINNPEVASILEEEEKQYSDYSEGIITEEQRNEGALKLSARLEEILPEFKELNQERNRLYAILNSATIEANLPRKSDDFESDLEKQLPVLAEASTKLLIASFDARPGVTSEVVTDTLEGFLETIPTKEDQAWQELYIEILKEIKEVSEVWGLDNSLEIQNRKDQIYALRKTNREKFNEFCENLDAEEWNRVRNDPGVILRVGPKKIKEIDALIGQEVLNQVLRQTERTEESLAAGNRLLHFVTPESLPFIILNAYREVGSSGDNPFLITDQPGNESKLYKVISSLNDEQLEEIAQLQIPGLVEFIVLVRQNPENFNQESMQAEMLREIQKISGYYLHSKDPQIQTFSIPIYEYWPIDPGAEAVALLLDAYDTFNPELKARVIDSIMVMLKNLQGETSLDPQIAGSLSEGVRKFFEDPDFWDAWKNSVGAHPVLISRWQEGLKNGEIPTINEEMRIFVGNKNFWDQWVKLSMEAQDFLTGQLKNNMQITEEMLDFVNDDGFWKGFNRLPAGLRREFALKWAEDLKNGGGLKLDERVRRFAGLSQRIDEQHSRHLDRIKLALISQLADNPNPEEAINKIFVIFERNNLPLFAKNFLIFEILYETADSDGKTLLQRELDRPGSGLSPVLIEAGSFRRTNTIFLDLLKIEIESNSQSFYSYISSMAAGEALIEKFETGGIQSLTPAEQTQLTMFLTRAGVVYEHSVLGSRVNSVPGTSEIGETKLADKIASLRRDLGVKPKQKIMDRLVDMFARPLGYSSLQDVLEHMDEVEDAAHARNISNPGVAEGRFIIRSGDLIKGIGLDALSYILRGGCVAKDYLGPDADSDKTPFDTDTSMVLEGDSTSFENALNTSLAKNYGNVMLIIRDRGQFRRSETGQETSLSYDPNRYELFNSNVLGPRHFGIRTGIPSTEIDAIVLRDVPDVTARQELFFQIANNGFYIPVLDTQGNVIFTEDDYNAYRLNRQSIQEALASPDFSPETFLTVLKSSPYLSEALSLSAGVSEGYSVERHTQMVMSQFERYFASNFSSSILTLEDFRLLLSLHDIGKGLAVRSRGSTGEQHSFSRRVLEFALQTMGTTSINTDTIIRLIDQDILGNFLRKRISLDIAKKEITDLALLIGTNPTELLGLLRIFYICDAGAYTSDAGGKSSLDELFIFTNTEQGSTADFSPALAAEFSTLSDALAVGV